MKAAANAVPLATPTLLRGEHELPPNFFSALASNITLMARF